MTASFNWDQFPVVESAAPEQSQGFNWDQFPVTEEPTKAQELKRHAIRTGLRAGETLAGIPGDITQLSAIPAKALQAAVQAGTGKDLSQIDITRIMDRAFPLKGIPTTERIRGSVSELTGGKFEPQSEGEQLSDEIASDIASLSLPVKGKIPFTKSIGLSVASNLAKEGVKPLGVGEKGQAATKLGTLFLLSTFNPKGATKYASDLYKEAKTILPEEASVGAKNLRYKLEHLQDSLHMGGKAPSKTKAIEKIGEIKKIIKRDQIAVEELTEFKKTINELRSGLYREFESDKVGRKLAKKNLDSVSSLVDETLSDYGRSNPEWGKTYRAANEAYGAIAQSRKVSDWIRRNVIPTAMHKGALGIGGIASALFKPITVPTVAAGVGVLKTGELAARIAKSPILRKYYSEVVKSALRQDAATTISNLQKMDAVLKKESAQTE